MMRSPAFQRVRAPEAKYCDMPSINEGVGIAAQGFLDTQVALFKIYSLNNIQEGASNFNRLGRRVRLKSIHIVGNFTRNAVAPPGAADVKVPYMARFALVYDRQPAATGVFPTAQEIWLQRDQQGTASNGLNWPWAAANVDNVDRFQVLRDCKFGFATNDPLNVDQVVITVANQNFVQGTQCMLYKKLRGMETHYRSQTNPITVADISTGALYFCIYSDANAVQGTISFRWSARLRYWDAL
jgi:hypothetical protein